MKKEELDLLPRQRVTVSVYKYNPETRNVEVLDTKGNTHLFPYETEWRVRLSSGMEIEIITYREEGSVLKVIEYKGLLIGQYGPQEKFKRDQYYGNEVSIKAAGL